MNIHELPITAIIPYARNPRENSAAVDKVAASIKEFGWRQPIVVDSSMTVVAGHTRLLAAKRLGKVTVPVHVAHGLTDQQIKAYRLADNRSGEDANWNIDLLALELKDLEDFGLELTGFDLDEIDSYLALGDATGEGLTDENEIPEPPETPVTKPGDVWVLGKHRLVCGDCTDPETVGKCLNGVEPHLMVTDPPYGVDYDPAWRDKVGVAPNKATGLVENDDKANWCGAWTLFPGDVAYVWHAGLTTGSVVESLTGSGFLLRAQIIWAKQTSILSRGDYHWQHEACWYAVRKSKTGHWSGDRKQTTVWHIKNASAIDGSGEKQTGHSTQKPVDCMRRPIENNSSPGQAVYEPFCGSGTTIIAAEQTGRACHAIEINPTYVDLAVKRWEAYTGKIANLEERIT